MTRDIYVRYLRAIHGALAEAAELIDWQLLVSRGVPITPSDESALSDLKAEISALSGTYPTHRPIAPSMLPTFGISLGMSCSLIYGDHAGRIAARMMVASLQDLGGEDRAFANRRAKEGLGARSCFIEWVNQLQLTLEEKDEAEFAAKAFAEFTKRNIRSEFPLIHLG